MKQYQFKTNINCSGCVAKVTPALDQNEEIKDWKVDTNNPNKILTVETESLDEEQIKSIVEKVGFKAEGLN
jgi:copper chaperone